MGILFEFQEHYVLFLQIHPVSKVQINKNFSSTQHLSTSGVNKLPLPAAPPQGTNNDFYQEQGSLMNRKLNSDLFTFLKN